MPTNAFCPLHRALVEADSGIDSVTPTNRVPFSRKVGSMLPLLNMCGAKDHEPSGSLLSETKPMPGEVLEQLRQSSGAVSGQVTRLAPGLALRLANMKLLGVVPGVAPCSAVQFQQSRLRSGPHGSPWPYPPWMLIHRPLIGSRAIPIIPSQYGSTSVRFLRYGPLGVVETARPHCWLGSRALWPQPSA